MIWENEREPGHEFFECDINSEKIYNGSHVTVKNSAYYLLGFMERFNLSEICREELLKLLQYHLPLENKVVKTINKLNSKICLEFQTKCIAKHV